MSTSLPRGCGVGCAMNSVRGIAALPAAGVASPDMRVPHWPQNTNSTGTELPQLGQARLAPGADATWAGVGWAARAAAPPAGATERGASAGLGPARADAVGSSQPSVDGACIAGTRAGAAAGAGATTGRAVLRSPPHPRQ